MKVAVLAFTFAALAFALPQTTSTPPSSFKIANVVSGGTGCPQGSIDVKWTEDKVLPFHFGKEFTAAVGPKASITDSRKFCQLNLELEYTPGYSFAVYSAEYAGFANLETGVTGTVKSTYYFSGLANQTSSVFTLSGPTRTRFEKQDSVDLEVWSPCSGNALFNVHASVALTPIAGSASGIVGIARESGRLSSTLYVQWKEC